MATGGWATQSATSALRAVEASAHRGGRDLERSAIKTEPASSTPRLHSTRNIRA